MRRLACLALVGLVSCGDCGGTPEPTGTPILSRVESPGRLIEGRAASGQIGDFLFENSKARFVVQDAETATGWGIYGGSLVDAAPVRDDDREDDRLQEIFVQCDLRAFRPERAEIVNDGRNGEAAVLRFTGRDAGIPFLDAVITRDPLEAAMTVEYVLPPDGDTLEIAIRIKDERKTEAREVSCGLVLIRGDENPIFLDGIGDNPDAAGGEQPYIAAAAHDAPGSWVLFKKDGPLNVIVAQLGILPIGPEPVPFLANATVEERYAISVGARGDVESALEAMRRARGEAAPSATVEVDVAPVFDTELNAVLTFAREGRPLTAARAPATVRLEPGSYEVGVDLAGRRFENFLLEVDGDVQRVYEPVSVGRLQLDVMDAGGPTPARLWLTDGDGRRVHEQYVQAVDDVLLTAGTYTAYLSRGPTHEIFSAPVEIRPNETARLEAAIERVIDLTGWVSLDTHVHSLRSTDSQVSKRTRVLGAVAEGLDVLIATDHDGVTDYGPTTTELGLQNRLTAVSGMEMSMLYGHMNGFPLAPVPERYFSPSWAVYEEGRFVRMLAPHEVADRLREHGAAIVQANHPRSGQGVFGYVGLDPLTGDVSGVWPDIDAAEILNGKRLDEFETVRADIFALLASGRRVTATGSSDSHSAYSGLGYARTIVRATGDLDSVWTALREGRAVAVNGPYLFLTARAEGRTAEVGDTLAVSGPVQLDLRVEAPSWVSAERIVLFENGVPIFEKTLSPADADPDAPHVRFEGTVTATPAADAFYMAEVSGDESPPLIDESRSITNPIYVDRP